MTIKAAVASADHLLSELASAGTDLENAKSRADVKQALDDVEATLDELREHFEEVLAD